MLPLMVPMDAPDAARRRGTQTAFLLIVPFRDGCYDPTAQVRVSDLSDSTRSLGGRFKALCRRVEMYVCLDVSMRPVLCANLQDRARLSKNRIDGWTARIWQFTPAGGQEGFTR
jgi:hypothetical protein